MGNCQAPKNQAGSNLADLLARTARLMSKNDSERAKTLKLYRTLKEDRKACSQAVLNDKAVMGVLLDLSATTRSAGVVENALFVLLFLTVDDDERLLREHPSVVSVAMRKLELGAENATEGVQTSALFMLHNLAFNPDNKRDMVTKNPTLVPLLVAKLDSNLEQVQLGALCVLQGLTHDDDNAREMATLVPLLVAKMTGSTAVHATKVVYGLSCSPANRAVLRGNNSVVTALTMGREKGDMYTSFFSLLTLVNLFGAEEDSEVLKTDLAMLQQIFNLIALAMNKDGWDLNNPFLAFRYLCVVEHNRQLLWTEYGSEFLTSILAALQRTIDDKDALAAENAVSTLAQFSNDPEPLAWMRGNKPQLEEVFAKLAPFPDALKTAQFLQLSLDPPEVVAALAPVAGSKPTIMISYNWKHQAQARVIHLLLESQGYPVWRDEVQMQGNIMDAMASAVSVSSIVLVLVSPWYVESANCKLECLFAHEHKRKLVPVMVEPGYKLGLNWLGLLFAGALYYDASGFHDEAQMKPIVLGLLRSEVEGGQVAAAVPFVATTSKRPVPQNEAGIRQWLSKHENGKEVADRLVKEGLMNAKALEMLSKKSWVELKAAIELNAMQALTLETALKELF